MANDADFDGSIADYVCPRCGEDNYDVVDESSIESMTIGSVSLYVECVCGCVCLLEFSGKWECFESTGCKMTRVSEEE